VNPTPPRPNGVGRPGSGKHHDPAPERSYSPSPEGQRVPVLPSLEPPKPKTPRGDDPEAVRLLEQSEARERALATRLAQTEAELDRQSRVPELPSPRAAREGHIPGTSVSDAPPRARVESHQHLHFELPVVPEQAGPKSARQRASEAVQRNPILLHLLTLLLGGGGATVASTAIQDAKPVPGDSGAQAYGQLGPALEKFSSEQRAWNEATSKQVSFMLGVLEASGYKIQREAGAPIPQKVEIKATPAGNAAMAPVLLARGASAKPAQVQVTTPLPAAPKTPAAVVLPAELPGTAAPPKAPAPAGSGP
jgi:hypothetical protein